MNQPRRVARLHDVSRGLRIVPNPPDDIAAGLPSMWLATAVGYGVAAVGLLAVVIGVAAAVTALLK